MRDTIALLSVAAMLMACYATAADEKVEEAVNQEVGTKYLVFREDCFGKFSKFDFTDGECVAFTFSKLVGYLIIAGSAFFKLP